MIKKSALNIVPSRRYSSNKFSWKILKTAKNAKNMQNLQILWTFSFSYYMNKN